MPPRILFINNTSKLGAGTSRSLLLLLRHLSPAFQLSVVLDNASGRLPQVLKQDGIPCHILPGRAWQYLPSLIRLIVGGGYDLIYANNHSGTSRNSAWAAKATRRPFIWHIRESLRDRNEALRSGRPFLSRLRLSLTYTNQSLCFNFAAAVIANSLDTAERVKRLAPRASGKLITIPNGVDLQPFEFNQSEARMRTRIALGIPNGSLVIANVGMVGLRKNQKDALEATAPVMKECPHAHLCFFGERFDQAYAASLVQRAQHLGITDRVHLLGERDDVPSCLCCSDILLHTAREEAQGRVILEAMAARLPVVAYDVGGIHEALLHQETGFLAPFGDIPALVCHLTRLVERPELRITMGEKGYSRVREHFTAEGTAGQVQQVVNRVLKRS